MKFLNWNLMWASPTSARGRELQKRIYKCNPDVAVFTEATLPFLKSLGGHLVTADGDYGYQSASIRRKVALWSRFPWTNPDNFGHAVLPGGRFAAATLELESGSLRLMGLAICWSHAHVATGRKDRTAWQDHMTYLEGLEKILDGASENLVISGDFNQRIPRKRQPIAAAEKLASILAPFNCITEGLIPPINSQTIDHIATTRDLVVEDVRSISNHQGDSRLTDHFGVECHLASR